MTARCHNRANHVVSDRHVLMVSKLGRKARASKVDRLISSKVTLRARPVKVSSDVVANVAAVAAVSRRVSSHIRLKAKASRVMRTLSGRRDRRVMAAAVVTGKVARTNSATRLAVSAAGTERFSKEHRDNALPLPHGRRRARGNGWIETFCLQFNS